MPSFEAGKELNETYWWKLRLTQGLEESFIGNNRKKIPKAYNLIIKDIQRTPNEGLETRAFKT